MIATSMRPPPTADRTARHGTRWRQVVLPAVVFALVPKCMLCGLAYLGLGTLLGLTGSELCGGGTSTGHWVDWLMWSGGALGLIIALRLRHRFGNSTRNATRGMQTGSPG